MDKYTPKTELIPIGNIAKSFGISDNTIRRMEAAGLLTPAEIKESGYRYYDADNIFRIKTILTLRNFGLVYDDMREFFNSSGDFTLVYDIFELRRTFSRRGRFVLFVSLSVEPRSGFVVSCFR